MKINYPIALTLIFSLGSVFSARGDELFPPDDLQRVQKFFEAKMFSRYMEQNCESTTYPGWEKFPTQLCK